MRQREPGAVALTVILYGNMPKAQYDKIMSAIKLIKGVIAVEPIVPEPIDQYAAYVQAMHELHDRVAAALEDICGSHHDVHHQE
jgi:hypothetical protein